jgi:solute carrier family 35 protein E3
MSDAQKFQLGTIGALSLSVVSSVSIVICNKALISTLGFTFGKIMCLLILVWFHRKLFEVSSGFESYFLFVCPRNKETFCFFIDWISTLVLLYHGWTPFMITVYAWNLIVYLCVIIYYFILNLQQLLWQAGIFWWHFVHFMWHYGWSFLSTSLLIHELSWDLVY